MGYYRDHTSGLSAATLPLSAFIDAHKPDDFRVDLTDLCDGRHFPRRAAARKAKTAAYISVNGNCTSTVENLITTAPPAEVIANGV